MGNPVPSPALFAQIGNRFRREVRAFAAEHAIPILHLKKPDRRRWDDRKLDHVRPYLQRAEREGRFGVVAIVAAQEFQWVFDARNRSKKPGVCNFEFEKAERRVSVYYFYVHDREFGPGFVKICSYFPYPAKVWLNGHEWAKRQAERAGIAFTALSNGFASCDQPEPLQRICDRFGPADVQAFFDRWTAVIPTPFSAADRAAGYWWELSMRQVEVSRTLVFDDPRRARRFFEALVADNIDIGRPEQLAIVFARQVRKTTREPFRTRVFAAGSDVKLDVGYKHSRLKQYLKDGRALRVEALIIERAGQSCAIGSALFERIHQPYTREGQRTGALRFGDQRAMALAGALCSTLQAVTGFSNKSLRGQVAGLLGQEYSPNQMSYDLRRLRLHGLIERLPRSNTYLLTGEGIRVAVFYSKLQNRLLCPLLAADQPPAPIEVRRALATLEKAVEGYTLNARIGVAAAA